MTKMVAMSRARWAFGLGVPVLLVALIGQLWGYPYWWVNSALEVWVNSMILIVAILMVIGFGSEKKSIWGVLISPANRYSLSLLQMILWTIVLIAAVVAFAVWRRHVGSQTMGFDIPREVWALLGLSTASLVGSPLIISQKDPDAAPLVDKPDKPRLIDLVEGEEKANEKTIDLSRVQMLLFTVIAVGSYAAALSAQLGNDCVRFEDLKATFEALGNADGKKKLADLIKLCNGNQLELKVFPSFSASLLAIIAISHAGYLTLKAVNKKKQPNKAANKKAPPKKKVS